MQSKVKEAKSKQIVNKYALFIAILLSCVIYQFRISKITEQEVVHPSFDFFYAVRQFFFASRFSVSLWALLGVNVVSILLSNKMA